MRIELSLHALRLLHQLLVQGAVHATAVATAATVIHSIRLQKDREKLSAMGQDGVGVIAGDVAAGGTAETGTAAAVAADGQSATAEAAAANSVGVVESGAGGAGDASSGTANTEDIAAVDGPAGATADGAGGDGASASDGAAMSNASAGAEVMAAASAEGADQVVNDSSSGAQGIGGPVGPKPVFLTEAEQQQQLAVKLGRVNDVLLRALDAGVLKVLLTICDHQAHQASMVGSAMAILCFVTKSVEGRAWLMGKLTWPEADMSSVRYDI
jgi:hypothetical protein